MTYKHVAIIREGRSAFKIVRGKSIKKNTHLGRPEHRWEENIEIYLTEIGINTINWVDSSQDRDYSRGLVNAVLNLRVP